MYNERHIPSRHVSLSVFQIGGGLAQLGERVVRNDEVGGSIPLPSTKNFTLFK
jgi:hypothetical protein